MRTDPRHTKRRRIVFPVRFAAAGRITQTTSLELSETGVFVRCEEQPHTKLILGLELHLPGVLTPVDLVGIVRESLATGHDAGFWAEFLDVGETDRRTILDLLVYAPEGRVGNTRLRGTNSRWLPRYPSSFPVKCFSRNQIVQARVVSVSAAGMFVQTEMPDPDKSLVRLVLELPDGRAPIEVDVQVIYTIPPGTAQRTAGMGVQFIGGTDSFRRRLDAYIKSVASISL